MWRQDVASQPHASSGRGVTTPCGVRTWRHHPMRRQDVASRAHVASGRGVTSPCGVTSPWQDVASQAHIGVREPHGVTERGVGEWRHVPLWVQAGAATKRHRPGNEGNEGNDVIGKRATESLATCQRAPVVTGRGVKKVSSAKVVSGPDAVVNVRSLPAQLKFRKSCNNFAQLAP